VVAQLLVLVGVSLCALVRRINLWEPASTHTRRDVLC
jgi:hypothetical protein